MIIKWKPFWYELDWPIVVGDVDWFDVKNDGYFYNGVLSKEQRKDFSFMKIEIERIIHPVLGEVKGIITFGLDYTIYLANGEIIEVNAEENPGMLYENKYDVKDWTFDVYVTVFDKTNYKSNEKDNTEKESYNQIVEKYKKLLGVSEVNWS